MELGKITTSIILIVAAFLSACTESSDSTKVVISETCSLDAIIGTSGSPPLFRAVENSDIEFQGWIADTSISAYPKKVNVELLSSKNQVQYIVNGTAGIKRPDVATAFKSPAIEDSGFSIKTKITNIKPGEYDVLLEATYDAQIAVCRSNKKIIVQ